MALIIGDCMTQNPVTITADLSLDDAAARMHQNNIRHLPVMDGGHVVGLISERDIALVSGIPGVVSSRVAVVEAMSNHPFIVAPDASVEEVVKVMHEQKIGTALVMNKGQIEGIFSVIDALEILLIMLRKHASD